jgi:hypothetical protein
MKKVTRYFTVFIVLLISAANVYAESYQVSKITHVYSTGSGDLGLKWVGSPRPGPCGGENYGWVKIPSTSSEAIKAMALSLYISGKPARIDTSGCNGAVEIVRTVYSPGG